MADCERYALSYWYLAACVPHMSYEDIDTSQHGTSIELAPSSTHVLRSHHHVVLNDDYNTKTIQAATRHQLDRLHYEKYILERG